MALRTLIAKDAYGELPEALQEYYKEDGDGYILDLDGVDDHPSVKGLKSKLDEVMGETKTERERRKALEQAQTEAERKAAEEKGEFEKLYKKTQDELEAERRQAREFREQITQRDIRSSAQEIARALASKDAKRADLLAEKASQYAKFEDGQIRYEIGGMKVDPQKVAEHLKTEYPFLVDGSQASGGGATGAGDGVPKGKEVSRQQWDQMSHNDRSAFAKDGGKVIDSD
jgi:septal ring factor EnvC (AmiA/AmiB activator)